MTTAISDFKLDIGLKSMAERVRGERKEPLPRRDRILPFSVDYLDCAGGGIFPNDLILVGAQTGIGKTTLVTGVIAGVAKMGRRADVFALEAEDLEVERHVKYGILCDLARHSSAFPRGMLRHLNYMDWSVGRLEEMLGRFEDEANALIAERFSTIYTLYRERDFTMPELEKRILAVQDVTDLVVIDHLHYIDTDDPNENRGYKAIVKRVRDVALAIGKPVILVAHVRKADRKNKTIVPLLDDFFGTSDVPKIATKAIVIAPAPSKTTEKHLWGTYMQVAKCRPDGTRTRYIGYVDFNARANVYEKRFLVGRASADMTEWSQVGNDDLPPWAEVGKSQQLGLEG